MKNKKSHISSPGITPKYHDYRERTLKSQEIKQLKEKIEFYLPTVAESPRIKHKSPKL